MTVGFELFAKQIETALLEAANKLAKIDDFLKESRAYVWITEFCYYDVEYTNNCQNNRSF